MKGVKDHRRNVIARPLAVFLSGGSLRLRAICVFFGNVFFSAFGIENSSAFLGILISRTRSLVSNLLLRCFFLHL